METLQLGYGNGDGLPHSGMQLGFDCLMGYRDKYEKYVKEYGDMDIYEMVQNIVRNIHELKDTIGYTCKMVSDITLNNMIGQNMSVYNKFSLPSVMVFPYICSPEKKERCSSG
jgi:hypothetical protein